MNWMPMRIMMHAMVRYLVVLSFDVVKLFCCMVCCSGSFMARG